MEYPKAEVKAGFEKMLCNGNRLPGHALLCSDTGHRYRVYLDELFYAIYMPDETRGDYKPVKIFGREPKGKEQRAKEKTAKERGNGA